MDYRKHVLSLHLQWVFNSGYKKGQGQTVIFYDTFYRPQSKHNVSVSSICGSIFNTHFAWCPSNLYNCKTADKSPSFVPRSHGRYPDDNKAPGDGSQRSFEAATLATLSK